MVDETTPTNDAATAVEETQTDAAAETTALGDAATTEAGKTEVTDAAKTEADKTDTGKEAGKPEIGAELFGAPEKYDFAEVKMPEGVTFDAELFDALEPTMREMNLSQKGVEPLVKAFAEKGAPVIAKRVQDAQDEAGAELRANLARDLQSDPEVGGKNLDKSKAMAARAIAKGLPNAADRVAFSKFMNESGLGNHPMLMRVLACAGKQSAEADVPVGDAAKPAKSIEEKFYGTGGN